MAEEDLNKLGFKARLRVCCARLHTAVCALATGAARAAALMRFVVRCAADGKRGRAGAAKATTSAGVASRGLPLPWRALTPLV